jgi:hypothetical protein
MSTPSRRHLPPLVLALAAALLAAGCAARAGRPPESRVATALPESDPVSRGTVQGATRPLAETEQLVVQLGRDADGRVVVLKVLSPVLTPEQQEEVRRAFAIGGFQRKAPRAPESGGWIETLTPRTP